MSINPVIRDALVVGICQYGDLPMSAQLETLAKQAEQLAQLLETQGGFKVTRLPCAADLTLSLDKRVTLPELEKAIEKLLYPPEESPTQTALLFFAGHGLVKETKLGKEGFLATSEADGSSVYGFSLKTLRELLRNSPIKQQIVFLESCHSGEFFTHFQADEKRDFCFVTSARANEEALAVGLLTNALLKILDYTNQPKDTPWVNSDTLIENLRQKLTTTEGGQRFEVQTQGHLILTNHAFSQDLDPNAVPYKGLHYFDNKPEDALFFKGRENLIAELITKVKDQPFLAVLGASGNGKSSVIRAGVLYQLQQSERWQIVNPFTPTANPLTALTNGLGTTEVLTFVQASAKARVILTIDQFEEIFSLCQDSQARDTFFNTLLDAVEQAEGKLRLIVVMRADFMDKCSQYPRLARYFQDHPHIVTRPTEDEIQQIIEAPAKQAGFAVEPRLVAEVVTDFKDSLGGLPLLEFALTTLWEKGKADRLLRYADYQALGGIQGILEKKATETYKDLMPEEQVVAKRVFLELTELGEGKSDTRRLVPQTDLLGFTTTQTSVEQVIAKLVKEHLIVTDKTEVMVVNIAHDALIEHWSVLRKWLDQSREDLKLQRQIDEGAKAWKEGKKALLVGVDLARAEEYLGTHLERVPLSESGVEFVKASVARERRQSRLKQALVSLVFVAAIVAVWFAYRASENEKIALVNEEKAVASQKIAQEEKNRALRGQSLLLADFARQETEKGNAINGILLALEALPKNMANPDRPYVNEAETQLYNAIFHQRELKVLKGHKWNDVVRVAFSPNGQFIITVTAKSYDNNSAIDDPHESITYLWDASSGNLLFTYEGIFLAFNPDNQSLFTTNDNHDMMSWSVNTGEPLTLFKGHQETIQYIAFTNEQHLVTVSSAFRKNVAVVSKDLNSTVIVWETNGGKKLSVTKYDGTAYGLSLDGNLMLLSNDSIEYDNVAIELWNVSNSIKITTFKNRTDAYFSPDNQYITLYSYKSYDLMVWDINSAKERTIFRKVSVDSTTFSPNNQRITVGFYQDADETWDIDVLDIASGKKISKLEDDGHLLAVSSNGQHIITVTRDPTLNTFSIFHLWDAYSSKEILVFRTSSSSYGNVAAFNFDGQYLITGHDDGTARLWDISNKKTFSMYEGETAQDVSFKAIFSHDGQYLATQDRMYNGEIRLWEIKSGKFLSKLTIGKWFSDIVFSADNQSIVTAVMERYLGVTDTDGIPILFMDVKSGKQSTITLSETGIRNNELIISPNGKYAIDYSGEKQAGNVARLWNLRTGKQLGLLTHEGDISYATFSPDEQYLLITTSKATYLWEIEGKKLLFLTRGGSEITHATFSSDNKLIATVSPDMTIDIWDIDSTKQLSSAKVNFDLNKFNEYQRIVGIVFSQDNHSIIIIVSSGYYSYAYSDAILIQWNITSGEQTTFFVERYSRLLAISPDGQRVVTSSRDDIGHLWDISSDKEIAIFKGHENSIEQAMFSHDGRYLVTASWDKTARLWPLFPTTQDLIDYARQVVPRQLNCEECRRFNLGNTSKCEN